MLFRLNFSSLSEESALFLTGFFAGGFSKGLYVQQAERSTLLGLPIYETYDIRAMASTQVAPSSGNEEVESKRETKDVSMAEQRTFKSLESKDPNYLIPPEIVFPR